jgi:hypothetical protein
LLSIRTMGSEWTSMAHTDKITAGWSCQ